MSHHRKKILFVITKSNFGGAQRYVYELATNLPRDQYEVEVAFGGSGLLKEKLVGAGIQTHTISSFERDIDIKKEIASWQELYHLYQRVEPDIVHLNSSKAGGSGSLIARLCGVPHIVFTAHGWPFYEDRSFMWRTVVWLLSYITTLFAHRVIVVSKHDLRHARMPGLSHKITHISTALPSFPLTSREESREALFPSPIAKLHEKDVWLVSTSEHTKNKNLVLLLSALADLKKEGNPDFFLTLMSEGELSQNLKSLVSSLKLENHVYFTGYVPDARNYLKAFDVFVLPSLKEGLPYGLLEAGAAGLAAVASNVGGIPEIITPEKNGELIEPHRKSDLVRALKKLLDSPALREEYGKNLQEYVETHYTLSRMLADTVAVYSVQKSI